jgi:deoxyribose-phosphate aldolase
MSTTEAAAPLVAADPTAEQLARMLDHAILQPTFTDAQMRAELEGLKGYRIATVCIKPYAVPLAAEVLAGTEIGVGTVIGFPHGSPRPDTKAAETERAFDDGAAEVDMVVNVGKVLSEDWAFVREDIGAVRDVTRRRGGLLKVIFETDFLPDDAHKITLCEVCSELNVDYVKTSTGFGFSKGTDGGYSYKGATEHDIALMRRHCVPSVGVKASGGVRSLADALKFVRLGATRLGTTSTHAILKAAAGAGDAAARGEGY